MRRRLSSSEKYAQGVGRAKLFATGRVQIIGDHGVFHDGSRTRVTHLIEALASGRLGRHPSLSMRNSPFDNLPGFESHPQKGRHGSQVTPFSGEGDVRAPGYQQKQ
jgi:hypothetical protein